MGFFCCALAPSPPRHWHRRHPLRCHDSLLVGPAAALLAARLAAAARTCGLRHVAFLFSPDWLHWSEEKELERRDALALCAAALPAAPRLALHFGVTDWSYSVSEHGGNSKLAALLDRMLPGRLRARVRVADGGPLYSELAAAAAACGLLAGEQQQQQPVADA